MPDETIYWCPFCGQEGLWTDHDNDECKRFVEAAVFTTGVPDVEVDDGD